MLQLTAPRAHVADPPRLNLLGKLAPRLARQPALRLGEGAREARGDDLAVPDHHLRGAARLVAPVVAAAVAAARVVVVERRGEAPGAGLVGDFVELVGLCAERLEGEGEGEVAREEPRVRGPAGGDLEAEGEFTGGFGAEAGGEDVEDGFSLR